MSALRWPDHVQVWLPVVHLTFTLAVCYEIVLFVMGKASPWEFALVMVLVAVVGGVGAKNLQLSRALRRERERQESAATRLKRLSVVPTRLLACAAEMPQIELSYDGLGGLMGRSYYRLRDAGEEAVFVAFLEALRRTCEAFDDLCGERVPCDDAQARLLRYCAVACSAWMVIDVREMLDTESLPGFVFDSAGDLEALPAAQVGTSLR